MKAFLDGLLKAARTSELWVLLFQAYTEAMAAPVPDEVQLFGWVYVALRVLSKVVKYIFPDGTEGRWLAKD